MWQAQDVGAAGVGGAGKGLWGWRGLQGGRSGGREGGVSWRWTVNTGVCGGANRPHLQQVDVAVSGPGRDAGLVVPLVTSAAVIRVLSPEPQEA